MLNRLSRPSVISALTLDLSVNRGIVEGYGFVPHIWGRGEEKRELEKNPKFRAKSWIVEVLHSWLKRFRILCSRYEKTVESFRALLTLAMGMIIFNKVIDVYP